MTSRPFTDHTDARLRENALSRITLQAGTERMGADDYRALDRLGRERIAIIAADPLEQARRKTERADYMRDFNRGRQMYRRMERGAVVTLVSDLQDLLREHGDCLDYNTRLRVQDAAKALDFHDTRMMEPVPEPNGSETYVPPSVPGPMEARLKADASRESEAA